MIKAQGIRPGFPVSLSHTVIGGLCWVRTEGDVLESFWFSLLVKGVYITGDKG